ncbi:hypothetical protein K9N68_20625 [Kovacikia minuta CCNUW1]|uniref:hypothetical protein n=1 Tax=Kovacikia minuta TaxID=2931930 RepID=UPI001CCCBFF2|nr:hypothetical protein [Kovacikia minuta]UBF24119.1 hypothetical protein K9N68_20625 [Kovacikia minuta CCNUW1]
MSSQPILDLLFSDELFKFLASRQLESGKMYRLDRYDVCSDVPLESSLDEQLEYCKHNLLRINRCDGMEYIQVKDTQAEEEIVPIAPTPPAWQEKIPDAALPTLAQLRNIYKKLLPTSIKDAILRQLPPDAIDWLIRQQLLAVKPPPPPEAVELEAAIAEPDPPHPRLHTNACGDFTLLSKADWLALRGYAEFEMYSFHIDSVFCYTAAYAGIEEVILEDPMRMYHIEHGGGWTPETEKDLDQRLATRKIPKMTYEQLLAVMDVLKLQRQGKRTFENIFNNENWGLADETLPESNPVEQVQVVNR